MSRSRGAGGPAILVFLVLVAALLWWQDSGLGAPGAHLGLPTQDVRRTPAPPDPSEAAAQPVPAPRQSRLARDPLDAGPFRYPVPRKGTPASVVVRHDGFALGYAEDYELAAWVAYELTAYELKSKRADRSDAFVPDDAVSTGTAHPDDYRNTGYDRGHLAPAADMRHSPAAMADCFRMSNIAPQVPAFNTGIWRQLEGRVRNWARTEGALVVVCGPVLAPDLPRLRPGSAAVPRYYYKVLLDQRGADRKAVGFVLPNAATTRPLRHFAVPVDSVEALTGLDFFDHLPDAEEQRLERRVDLSAWRLTRDRNP